MTLSNVLLFVSPSEYKALLYFKFYDFAMVKNLILSWKTPEAKLSIFFLTEKKNN